MHYIGQTNGAVKRLVRHNSGNEKFTKKGVPWELNFFAELDPRSDAMKLEKKVKNFKVEFCKNVRENLRSKPE